MTEKLEWSRWSVPHGFIKQYIILMLGVLIIFPKIVGLQLTILGYVLNYVWADFMFFILGILLVPIPCNTNFVNGRVNHGQKRYR